MIKKNYFCMNSFNHELTNSAIVVVIQRNAGHRIIRALSSIYNQDYEDIGILFIDDASIDDTVELALDFFLRVGTKDKDFSLALHLNSSKTPKILSLYQAINKFCENPNSVIFLLDGDDELLTAEAIRVMIKDHNNYDVVWSQHEFVNLKKNKTMKGFCAPLESDQPRQYPWVSSHLKSFKNHLFQAIKDEMLRDESGRYYPFATDRLIMYLLIEMVGKEKCFFRDKVYYRYYHDTPEDVQAIQQECTEKLLRKEIILFSIEEKNGSI